MRRLNDTVSSKLELSGAESFRSRGIRKKNDKKAKLLFRSPSLIISYARTQSMLSFMRIGEGEEADG